MAIERLKHCPLCDADANYLDWAAPAVALFKYTCCDQHHDQVVSPEDMATGRVHIGIGWEGSTGSAIHPSHFALRIYDEKTKVTLVDVVPSGSGH